MDVFYAKMPNSKNFKPPSFTEIWALIISGCKIQNPTLDCFWACWKVSKMVSHDHGLLSDQGSGGGPLGVGSPTQQYNFCCVLTVNIWPRFNLPVKSYSIYVHRQTDTFSIPVGRDEIFYSWKFIPFHITMFICLLSSLIHSVLEG